MDMAALVLTLKWPANSINQAFADSSLLERLRRSPEREAAPLGQAQRHWRLIRTLCIEYTRAHRYAADSATPIFALCITEMLMYTLHAGQKKILIDVCEVCAEA